MDESDELGVSRKIVVERPRECLSGIKHGVAAPSGRGGLEAVVGNGTSAMSSEWFVTMFLSANVSY